MSGAETTTYTKPAQFIICVNQLCVAGGLEVGAILHNLVAGRKTEVKGSAVCGGSEGAPRGRKIFGKCLNHFAYNISIKYNEAARPNA